MACPGCGRAVRSGARFCGACGTSLAPRCSACGSENEPGLVFCESCGASLAAAPPASAAEAVSRKVVTIVFADLVGSTALHERLDAEAVRQFMEGYYAAMRGAVEAHGGRVTQLMGDGVKAVFGAPRVAEDDAIRAVRAAVAMQDAFRALAGAQRGRVGATGLRVAVNTGEVVADDATEIIGDPVNVAARLQERGHDGDVVIGGSTQRIVASLVMLERLGSFALKGRSEAVEAYRVVSLEAPAAARAAAFVGRDDELRRILGVYEAAVAAPATRLALLLGSPGLGKSRLLDEVAHRLAGRATLLSARCEAAGSSTFAPLAGALRALLGIEGAEDGDLHAALARTVPGSDEERARIAAGIEALLAGTPLSPEETFYDVRRLLAALAAERPVVLAIDDLHWAEPLLLDLIEHLVQWGSGVPLLVLAAARPELREARSALAVPGAVAAEVITLGGLDATAASRLAASVIGADALPAAVAGRVLTTSEGNPLFLRELVRMLVNDGVLRREGERWQLGVAVADLDIPPTIQALLAARIERLRPEDRLVLERAAVVGRHFSRASVAQLLPRESADLGAHLESLRRSELIEPDTGWFLGEPALRFHHVLIRDAAYRRVLKNTRAELHARLADWIEARPGEHDETLGWHLEQAHQNLRELGTLDERARSLGERAARHLGAAGRRALARDDLPLAASLLGRALDRLDAEDPARAELALDWCEALLSAGDVAPAAEAVAELARFAAGSERLGAWHTCFAGQLAVLTDPAALRSTAAAVARAAELLASAGDAAGEAKAHAVHATALSRLGEIGACEAALDRALAAARRVRDRRRQNAVLAGTPVAALWGPRPVMRASGSCLDVVRVLRITQGSPAVEAVALRCQAVLEALRGRSDAARRMIAASRRMAEELGITQQLLEVDVFAGHIELLEGDAAAAERSLRHAYEGLCEQGLGIDAARAAALLGRALLAQGRAAEAEALSHESEALAGDDLKAAIAWRGVRAEALAERGDAAAAVELARAAVAIAAATDVVLDHADARLALAAALRAAGRPAEADAEQARATQLWEQKGATLLAERARDAGGRAPGIERTGEAHPAQANPVRRRVRENAAIANLRAVEAAAAARNTDAFEHLFGDGAASLDHTTGAERDRAQILRGLPTLLTAEAFAAVIEPVATLGDKLVLARESRKAKGVARGDFDVGPYERNALLVHEVDSEGRAVWSEYFATDHLGDAVARLYERHTELLPEGEGRTRAAATARTVAALAGPLDLERGAELFAPDIKFVDPRAVGPGIVHGAEALVRTFRAIRELAEEFTVRIDDVLAVRPGALLVRRTDTGLDRSSGGAFERNLCQLWIFGADGLLTRWEQSDAERVEEALARFDALTAEAPRAVALRRVRPNAATENVARLNAASAAPDLAALASLLADGLEIVSRTTGMVLDRSGVLEWWRQFPADEDATFRVEPIATLGEALALCHQTWTGSASVGPSLDVGAFEMEMFFVYEVDAAGRAVWVDAFGHDRLGDAAARLYERHAERLAEGQGRARAAATARSVAVMLRAPGGDPGAVIAPGLEFSDRRTPGLLGHSRGAEAYLRGLHVFADGARDRVLRLDDVVAARPDALLVHRAEAGVDRASGGAYENRFLTLWTFGEAGLVERVEWFDSDHVDEALARFDALTAEAPRPAVRRRGRPNAATANVDRLNAAGAARDVEAIADSLSDAMRSAAHTTSVSLGKAEALAWWRMFLADQEATHRLEPLATLGASLALCHHSWGGRASRVASLDVGAFATDQLQLWEVDSQGRAVRTEGFAPDRLGDAVTRLYERHLLPEGAERTRAAATARSMATMLTPFDSLSGAALAPGVEFVDRRRLALMGRSRGAERFLRGIRAYADAAPDRVLRTEDVVALRPDALLTRRTESGIDRASGGPYENHLLTLWTVEADGRVGHLEWFDPDSADEALARFDALTAEAPRPAVRRRVPPNGATANAERFDEAFAARDEARLAELFADPAETVHHPTGSTSDRQGILADLHETLVAARSVAFREEPLASLGASLALFRASISAAGGTPFGLDLGPTELEQISLLEVDAEGRRRRAEVFAADHLAAAVARLYERHAELLPDGPERTSAQTTARLIASMLRNTGPPLDGLIAPEMEFVDRRPLGLGRARGAERFMWAVRAGRELENTGVPRVHDVFEVRPTAILFHTTMSGTDASGGGTFERELIRLRLFAPDGRLAREEWFDPDAADEALARFDALTAVAPPARRRTVQPNAATRNAERLDAAVAARDLAASAGLFPESAQTVHHPTGATYDRDGILASIGTLFTAYEDFVRREEPLATLGESLALVRASLSAAGFSDQRFDVGALERENLALIEVDAPGLRRRTEIFAPDRLGDAVARLYGRYAELLPDGPERARAQTAARSVAAMLRAPHANFSAVVAPGLEFSDRRTLGLLGRPRGAETFLRAARVFADGTRDRVLRIDDVVAARSDALLAQLVEAGVDRASGGPYENRLLTLWSFGEGGLVERVEWFDPDRDDEALARFVEVSREPTTSPRFENAATRVLAQHVAAWNDHDWERYSAAFPPECRHVDRRSHVQLDLDRDKFLEYARMTFEMRGSRILQELLATRGERLALARSRWEGSSGGDVGPTEIDSLFVAETNERGELAAYVRFDPDALDAAFEELDARYDAGEAARYARPGSPERYVRARDWDALASAFAPGYVLEDHRPAGVFALHSVDEYVASVRAMFELAPDACLRVYHMLGMNERGALAIGGWEGTRDGGPFEIVAVNVNTWDAAGRTLRTDLYGLDQLDEARARFAGLSAPQRASQIENAATRSLERSARAWRERDWDGVAAEYVSAFRSLDRRRAMQLDLDRDGYLEFLRPLFELRASQATLEVLGTRGDRLALSRRLWTGADGDIGASASDALTVTEVDAAGLRVAEVTFEASDLDAAYAELDARYDAGEAAPYARTRELRRRLGRAVGARDREAAASAFAPGFVSEDHRPLGVLSFRSGEEFAASQLAVVELAPDAVLRTHHVLALDEHRTLTVSGWSGTRDGGAFETLAVLVQSFAPDGRAQRYDMYSLDQLDEARARFAEPRPDPLRIPPNAAWRAHLRSIEAHRARDWAALRALASPDFEFADRGKHALVAGGVEMWVANGSAIPPDSEGSESELIGTAGERVALGRTLWRGELGGSPVEREHLRLTELDAEGRTRAVLWFDVDDRAAAFEEAWARFVAGEAAGDAGQAAIASQFRAFNQRDWAAWQRSLTPDFVHQDHRTLGFGELPVGEWLASLRALVELAPDVSIESLRILRWNRHGRVEVNRASGTHQGGAFETLNLFVALTRGPLVGRYEFFDAADTERALARFEELCERGGETSDGKGTSPS